MKEPLLYEILRPVIKCIVKFCYRPNIIGMENMSKDGPIILAGNHTNNLDCILLMSCTKRCIHFLAKDSLSKGFKRVIFNNMGIIPVNRKVHDKMALKRGVEVLKSGGVIGIFPEGTINRTDEVIMPFKIGAIKMANLTSAQIVPFTIRGKYVPFKKNITIEFLKPYTVKSDNLDEENENLMNIIKERLEERT